MTRSHELMCFLCFSFLIFKIELASCVAFHTILKCCPTIWKGSSFPPLEISFWWLSLLQVEVIWNNVLLLEILTSFSLFYRECNSIPNLHDDWLFLNSRKSFNWSPLINFGQGHSFGTKVQNSNKHFFFLSLNKSRKRWP